MEGIKRYSKRTRNALYQAIAESYGAPAKVLKDGDPHWVCVDVLAIPPSEGRNYYTLVTFGMGARRMYVPQELHPYRLERAELIVHLPADWKLSDEDLADPDNSWPVNLLRRVACLPFRDRNYLGWGHSVEVSDTLAENNLFVGAMLTTPGFPGEASILRAGRKTVNFYEVMPLYIEELDYKTENDACALLRRMRGVSPILDIRRMNFCDGDDDAPLDDGTWHVWKMHYKHLATEEMNAYNHLAAYFEWCYLRGFVRPPFAVIDDDFRTHVVKRLGGRLLLDYFSGEGAAFTEAYFKEESDPSYYRDLAAYAEERLGTQRVKNDCRAEGYLFLPYDEAYRAQIREILDRRFEEWIKEQT